MDKSIESIIKYIGIIFAILGSICSIIFGINYMTISIQYGSIIAFLGTTSSFIISCFIYGFGVVIQKLKEIAKNTEKSE